MLKGFVSGEEKDIVRIPMKGKNLFDGEIALQNVGMTGQRWGFLIEKAGTYTINITGDVETGDFCYGRVYSNGEYSESYYLTTGSQKNRYTVTISNGERIIIFNASGSQNQAQSEAKFARWKIMANEGSTPLPYEPYGYQEGWEVRDSQDRLIWGREDELQTATGTLPFKGYSLPVKVKSLLGNAVQNGTPSPSPVNPNLADPSATVSGYQNQDGTIHVPSGDNERTTDYIPFTQTLYYLVSGSYSGNLNYCFYNANKQFLSFWGGYFSPNVSTPVAPTSGCAYIRFSWTNAANQPICVTTEQRSEYIAFDPNPPGPVIPEMCGVRSANLYDITATPTKYKQDTTVTVSGRQLTITGEWYIYYEIDVIPNTDYYVKWTIDYAEIEGRGTIIIMSKTGTAITQQTTRPFTFNSGENDQIRLQMYSGSSTAATVILSDIMLVSGSTAPTSYEPYGMWKIPFENHGENLWDEGYTGIDGNLKYVPVFVGEGTFTLSTDTPHYSRNAPLFLLSGDVTSGASTPVNGAYDGVTRTTDSTGGYVTIAFRRQSESSDPATHKTMLNRGSTALPYSPYLNEIHPVYLGEVPTVRRVKKYEFTGAEALQTSGSGNARFFYMNITGARSWAAIISDRYANTDVSSTTEAIGVSMSGNSQFRIRPDTTSTEQEFTQYLASEYAAGHPVVIWYVLAEPETAVSNEPLCKISTYADELTTIQAHGLSAPLYGIGEYKDTLNLSTGVVTRKVKKLVLTGTENWQPLWGAYNLSVNPGAVTEYSPTLITVSSTHFIARRNCRQIEGIPAAFGDNCIFFRDYASSLFIKYDTASDVTAFKSYLAAQYQNGTPVVVWYVLETPTTETVTVPTGMTGEIEGYLTQVSTPSPTNRSVPKWNGVEETGGTYAVTVYTPPEIPTTTGQNTLTVETEKIHGLTTPLCAIGDYKDVLNLSTGVITRKVKKLVLDGTETGWTLTIAADINVAQISLQSIGLVSVAGNPYICSTHYIGKYANENLICRILGDGGVVRFYDNANATNADTWKAYLAAQYQNGTPVTIWYALNTPETETITVPYGLECSVEGYLTQSGTPTPSSPITPDSNGILESGGTYGVEVSLVPSNLTVKGHIKELT